LQLIKQYIQKISLKRSYSANLRTVKISNLENVKTIGLISNPKNIAEIDEIDKIAVYFQGLGKQIFPLVYFDKEIENNTFTKNIGWIGFGAVNCNWLGRPKKDINLTRFISKEFDILIDLSFSKIYTLQYIFVKSKARLKIMPRSDINQQFADLILEASDPQDKLTFAKELTHYLEIINKDLQ